MRRKDILILVKTSRPLGWIVAPLVFFIGFLFSNQHMNILMISQLILLTFPYCLFLYGINDIYDYASDKVNPRKKLIEGIKLKLNNHRLVKNASFISASLLLASSIIALNRYNLAAMVLLLFFSYAYSAPPLRFKNKPPLDSLSNGMIYFLAPFMLGLSFGEFSIPLSALFVTLCVAGLHSFSTIMDHDADKKAKDMTFSVVFGKRAAALFSTLVFLFVIAFSEFKTDYLNYYLYFCTFLFSIAAIFPRQRLASFFFKLIFFGFILVASTYVFLNI